MRGKEKRSLNRKNERFLALFETMQTMQSCLSEVVFITWSPVRLEMQIHKEISQVSEQNFVSAISIV